MAATKQTLSGGRPILLAAVLSTGVAVGVLAQPFRAQDADAAHMSVQASASTEVHAGRVLIQVTRVQIGACAAPEPVRHNIEQYVQTQMDQTLGATRVTVQSVDITQGRLVILAATRNRPEFG